jgi:hypothetical protein
VPCRAVLCCAVLCCAVLCCAVLCTIRSRKKVDCIQWFDNELEHSQENGAQ